LKIKSLQGNKKQGGEAFAIIHLMLVALLLIPCNDFLEVRCLAVFRKKKQQPPAAGKEE